MIENNFEYLKTSIMMMYNWVLTSPRIWWRCFPCHSLVHSQLFHPPLKMDQGSKLATLLGLPKLSFALGTQIVTSSKINCPSYLQDSSTPQQTITLVSFFFLPSTFRGSFEAAWSLNTSQNYHRRTEIFLHAFSFLKRVVSIHLTCLDLNQNGLPYLK